jgi:uncharacterized DUF497 family protein/uncharacterized protein (DUF4415 family)
MIYYYNKHIELEYDPVKDQTNHIKHGVSLVSFVDLDWERAKIRKDERTGYSETRYVAAANLAGRLHITCFTLRGEIFRVISLRRANKRESVLIMAAKQKKPLTSQDGEVRELDAEDFSHFEPAEDVISNIAKSIKRLRGQRGKQKEPTKIQKTLRLSPEVVAYFQSQGKGWQTNVDKVLKEYVKSHK